MRNYKKNHHKTPMSKNIQRSLPQFNIYFQLLFLKLVSLPGNLVIGIGHSKLLCEITKNLFLWRPHDVKKYLEVATMMKIPWNILQFGTGLKHISDSSYFRRILLTTYVSGHIKQNRRSEVLKKTLVAASLNRFRNNVGFTRIFLKVLLQWVGLGKSNIKLKFNTSSDL